MDIISKKNLKGFIIAKKKITGFVNQIEGLNGVINSVKELIGFVSIGKIIKQEPYTENYEVTPSTMTQILKTKNKSMTDDVKVESIPYAEVTNTSNGITVTIGG